MYCRATPRKLAPSCLRIDWSPSDDFRSKSNDSSATTQPSSPLKSFTHAVARQPLFKSLLPDLHTSNDSDSVQAKPSSLFFSQQSGDSILFTETSIECSERLHSRTELQEPSVTNASELIDSAITGATHKLEALDTAVVSFTNKYWALLAENTQLKARIRSFEDTVAEQSLKINTLESEVARLNAAYSSTLLGTTTLKQFRKQELVQATFETVLASCTESFQFLDSILARQQLKIDQLSQTFQSLQLSTETYEEDSLETKELWALCRLMQKRYSSHFGQLVKGNSLEDEFTILCDSYHNQVLASNCREQTTENSETNTRFAPGQCLTRSAERSVEAEETHPESAVTQAAHTWLLEEYEVTCQALEAKEFEVATLLKQIEELQEAQQ